VHHAFKVAAEDFDGAVAFLRKNGIEVFNVEDRRDGVFHVAKPTSSIRMETNWRFTIRKAWAYELAE
jgi:hypothetical protein